MASTDAVAYDGDDRWTPPHLSQSFLTRIAGPTTYVELDSCGHCPVEEPGLTAMAEAMLAFLADVPGDEPSR